MPPHPRRTRGGGCRDCGAVPPRLLTADATTVRHTIPAVPGPVAGPHAVIVGGRDSVDGSQRRGDNHAMVATALPSAPSYQPPHKSSGDDTMAAVEAAISAFTGAVQRWLNTHADRVSKCYLALNEVGTGYEVYPVERSAAPDPEVAFLLAGLLRDLHLNGIPADGFPIIDGPITSLAAHFDTARVLALVPVAAHAD